MKNIFTVIALSFGFTFFSLSAYGQGCPGCVVRDTLCTGVGFGEVCADTFATATEGTAYTDTITFRFPQNYTVKASDPSPFGMPWGSLPFFGPGTFPYSAPVDTAYVSSVTGLPAGLNWETDSSANGNYYNPSGGPTPYGCMRICGAPGCAAAGTYTVQVTLTMHTNLAGLFAMGGIPFPIPALPVDSTFDVLMQVLPGGALVLGVTSPDSAVIYSGESIVIDATPGFASYQWTPTGDTTASIEPSPTDTTTYVVTATDAGGCAQTDSFTVYVIDTAAPCSSLVLNITSTGTAVIDLGDSIVLNATPGFASYSWAPGGATTASIEPSPTDTTTYVVTATDSAGCVQNDSFTVYVIGGTVGTMNIDVQPKINVYPNPGNGEFTVVLPAEWVVMDTRLVVYDVRGRQVYSELIQRGAAGTNKKLHLQMLDKGVYFLHLSSGLYNINHKLTIY